MKKEERAAFNEEDIRQGAIELYKKIRENVDDLLKRPWLIYSKVCMAVQPDGTTGMMTFKDAKDCFGEMDYEDIVGDGTVLFCCHSQEVFTFAGEDYLLGTALIYEEDDYGEKCGIDYDTVSSAMEYFEKNTIQITVAGKDYPALHLVR